LSIILWQLWTVTWNVTQFLFCIDGLHTANSLFRFIQRLAMVRITSWFVFDPLAGSFSVWQLYELPHDLCLTHMRWARHCIHFRRFIYCVSVRMHLARPIDTFVVYCCIGKWPGKLTNLHTSWTMFPAKK